MGRVILVRHGETVLNRQLRYSGQQETPLTALGQAQHDRLRARLRFEPIERILSSDLGRCRDLAEAVAADGAAPCELEPALREASFGIWERLTYEMAMARDRQAMVAFNRDPVQHGPPGGESLSALQARVRPYFDALVRGRRDDQGALLVVSHGGTLRVLLCSLLAIPLDRYWTLRIDPGGMTILDTYPLGAIIAVLNDTCHLADLAV